ncbi:uncharacterized protein J3D65DRAFT_618838 [Phyllosticta citribraziliensis]|uniref:Uncharacterized protein n=1 Tax=Phyllosticta citribraziliensis TaxID=989973 RepID=A0ABR1LWC7_9PEZI
MGIPGIYKEIGPGIRVALAKLAVQKFEETGRPLRIAIDTAIWLVQIQSSKGGTNPAMRTFFYRLLRLMKLSVHPLFVFDGPNKPSEKRNKKTGQTFASIPEYFAKQVLKKFGFPFHDAPGEAEAECALLQRSGIVDMVMSEDVDTIMFGSRNTIRPAQDPKSAKSATHFNLYDSDEIKAGSSGLDREGMILVAMMSGGDYLTEGIPGCGPKVACEAARAGFGKKLCELSPGDKRGLEEWKLELAEELRTNQSKYFKTKHAGLVLPEDFPRMKILKYYTHPAISSAAAIDRLRARISWDQEIHLAGVREITREVFKWQGKTGAKHFIRNLAPALLPRQLRLRGQRVAAEMSSQKTTAELEEEEGQLVVSIHGQRQHLSTDHMDELRVAIVPSKIVPIDMDAEDEDNEESLVDIEADLASAETPEEGEGSTKRPNQYDPDQPERHWVMDSFLKCGVPIKVEDWQETQRKKNAPKEKKPRKEKAKKPPAGKGGMPMGALDKFTTVTKSNAGPSGKPTRPKSPSVDRLDLSGIGDSNGERSGSLRPQKETSGTRPTEPTASMPDFVDLCSSPAVPITEKAHSFSEAIDEHYLSPNVTKRAKNIRRTKSANEPATTLTRLGSKKVAASNAQSRKTAGSAIEDSPSKRQVSIEESLRFFHGASSKRNSAALPSLDEVEQVDLTSSPMQPRTALDKNAAGVPTLPTCSNTREALSSTSENTTVANLERQSVGSNPSTEPYPKPSPAAIKPKKRTQKRASPPTPGSPRIDRVFGSSKKSTEAPKKRAIKVRESLKGGWMYVDRDTENLDLTGSSQDSNTASKATKGPTKTAPLKRKAWRESGVEMLDLTDV